MDDPPVDESRRVLILSRGLSSSPLFHQSSLNSNAEFQRSNSNVSENIDQLISDRLFAAHQRLKKLSTLRQSILASMAMQNHNRSRKILRKRTISTPTLGSAELLQQAKEFTLRRKSAIVTTKTMPVAAETSTMLASAWSKMMFTRLALEQRITLMNFGMLALSIATLAVSIAADQTCFDYEKVTYPEDGACTRGENLKAVALIFLVISQITLILYYATRSKARAINKYYASSIQSFFHSYLVVQYLIEATLLLIQPYPNINNFAMSGFGHKALLAVFVRIPLYSARVLHDWSPLFRRRADILKMSHLKFSAGSIDFWPVLKAVFNLFSLPIVACIFLYLITSGAYAIHVFERQYLIPNTVIVGVFNRDLAVFTPEAQIAVSNQLHPQLVSAQNHSIVYQYPNGALLDLNVTGKHQRYQRSEFESFSACLWYGLFTATRTGYGGENAATVGGRIVSSVLMTMGLILASLGIGSVAVALEPKPFQNATIEWLRGDHVDRDQRDAAATLIQTSFREWIRRKHVRQARQDLHDNLSRSAVLDVDDDSILTPRQRALIRIEAEAAVKAAQEFVQPEYPKIIVRHSSSNIVEMDPKSPKSSRLRRGESSTLGRVVSESEGENKKKRVIFEAYGAARDDSSPVPPPKSTLRASPSSEDRKKMGPSKGSENEEVPLRHMPLLKPLARKMRGYQRMQAEIALGTSMSYSQRTLMAARDQAVLLDQLQKGYQKRDDALVDMAQRMSNCASRVVSQGALLQQMKELVMDMIEHQHAPTPVQGSSP